MTGGFWLIAVAPVILVHGIGHVVCLAPCLRITQWGQAAHSWLLTRMLGDTATRVIGSVLWLVFIVGFMTAVAGLLGQGAWWRSLAVASASESLLALILSVSGSDAQPILSAALIDTAPLVALLWVPWPSVNLVRAQADWALGYTWHQLGYGRLRVQ